MTDSKRNSRGEKMKNYWELKKMLPNAANQNVINEFLLTIKTSKSQRTIEEYRIKLQCFFKETEVQFSSITMVDIEQWLTEDKGRKKNNQ